MIGRQSLAVFTPAELSDGHDVGYLPVYRSNTFFLSTEQPAIHYYVEISKIGRNYKQQVKIRTPNM